MPQAESYHLLFVLGELPVSVTIKPKPVVNAYVDTSKAPDGKNKPGQSKPAKNENPPVAQNEGTVVSFEHVPEGERQKIYFKNLGIRVSDIKSKVKDLTDLLESVKWIEANPNNEKSAALESAARLKFYSMIVDICYTIFLDKNGNARNAQSQAQITLDESRVGSNESVEKLIISNLPVDSGSIERVLDIFMSRGTKISNPILLYVFRKFYAMGTSQE
jgi:hypothetical protein